MTRDRAIEAESQAAIEKERAKSVLRFLLVDVLQQADPSKRPVPDLTVRTMLDGAAMRLESTTDMPEVVAASIRQTVGNAYVGLGAVSQAEPHLLKAH